MPCSEITVEIGSETLLYVEKNTHIGTNIFCIEKAAKFFVKGKHTENTQTSSILFLIIFLKKCTTPKYMHNNCYLYHVTMLLLQCFTFKNNVQQ